MYNKNAWEKYNEKNINLVMDFCEGYKDFLTKSKTEREMVTSSVELAKKYGFKDISEFKTLKVGDKVYATNKNKNFAAFIIGKTKVKDGINILGAHVDSPRIDIKQNPLYEDTDIAYLDAHYYGGIIKYQWVTVPMALHGVICKKDGSTINVNIGEDDNDPVFCISDLLIHLSQDKLTKPASKAVEGEDLDLIIGSGIKFKDGDKETVKGNIIRILKEKYGADEQDFISAELEIVPQAKTRDLGLDRSMVIGYGQDDKVCSYTSLMALLDSSDLDRTSSVYLVDKEEIGSVGATGAQSNWYFNLMAKLIMLQENNYNDIMLNDALENSYMLSSDVSAGFDPLYKGVFENKNSSYLGRGITFNKYTGSRGKSGCNDAMPEFMAKIRNIMDNNDIYYQTAELGKVDIGGGGTIAYIMGNKNMNVIDAGVPVLSMHAPQEITSKVDIYEAYLGYKAFIKNIK